MNWYCLQQLHCIISAIDYNILISILSYTVGAVRDRDIVTTRHYIEFVNAIVIVDDLGRFFESYSNCYLLF